MPRLGTDMDTHQIGGGNFTFSGARIANLGSTEYTLATVMVDVTGSVGGFETQLRDMLVTAVQSCQKSPRSDNLLLRVCTFSSMHQNGVAEIHGFKPLGEIDASAYPPLRVGGGTPLCDAVYSGVGATNTYGKQLMDQDFLVNAITFIITDGAENASTASMPMVKEQIAKALTGETLESHVSVLIGINAGSYKNELTRFQTEAGITQYIDAGDVTKGRLAKLAAFVSQSVSSTSQALGTQGPSSQIAAVI